MTIGFIGTGIISSYVVTGFCKSGREGIDIIVSPRSRDKSAALAAEFPQMVRVARTISRWWTRRNGFSSPCCRSRRWM